MSDQQRVERISRSVVGEEVLWVCKRGHINLHIYKDLSMKVRERCGECDNPAWQYLPLSQLEKVEAALREYGQHKPDCRRRLDEDCTCGFALTRARSLTEQEEEIHAND